MKKAKVDVAVLILFFNRPKMVSRVFEQVKKARPTKLFLYQDGAREGREDDLSLIQQCREVVADIDWECEVHYLYQEKNFGCDPSEYLAIRWMFDHVDKGIILEDDDVPALRMFPFCKELLDKYEDDERIGGIAGMNHLGTFRPNGSQADYFFAHTSSIWGWATWKRFVDSWETKYEFLDDPEKLSRMQGNFHASKVMKSDRVNFDMFIETCRRHQRTGVEFYETFVSATRFLYDQMFIFPCENMISNIGHEGESTHGVANLKILPRATQKLFDINRIEKDGEIVHPTDVVACDKYLYKKEKMMTPTIWNRPFRWLECKVRYFLYGRK